MMYKNERERKKKQILTLRAPTVLSSSSVLANFQPAREFKLERRELLYNFESGKLKMRWIPEAYDIDEPRQQRNTAHHR